MLLLVAGCAAGQRRPVRIPDHRAYLLTEVPEQFDLTAVQGRRILIDPGHGGPWPGAVGPNGVREADVNLGVALYLWGLLTEAGADVELTRTTDSAVSDLPDPTLKQDLRARAELATARNPDVFLSVHHNADIIPGSQKNDLETYYQLRGDPPSLDVAQSVHRHHARNLGERRNAVLPGNFHVLRETAVPAILGESSYISAEANAEHLAFAARQRLEAEAYFLGLVEYFSRGVPRIAGVEPVNGERRVALGSIRVRFELDRGVPMDPATVRVRLNGEELPVRYDQNTHVASAAVAETLASGVYEVTAWGRNVRGNATRVARSTFSVSRPARFISLTSTPPALHPAGDGRAILAARVSDAQGQPVLDGTPVQFEASAGTLAAHESFTTGGVATTPWDGGGAETDEVHITARAGGLSTDLFVRTDDAAPPTHLVQVVRTDTRVPIAGARLGEGAAPVVTNADGMAVVAGPIGGRITVAAAGYWPATVHTAPGMAGAAEPIALVPVAGGGLQGQVIAIDAAGGGAAAGARGPTGLRAADVNLRVARYLADYLRSAGAVPVQTRRGDETTSAFERVDTSERAGAARFISIRHGAGAPPERVLDETGHATTADLSQGILIEHYPTSAAGKRLAGFLRDSLTNTLVRPRPRVVQSVAYELTHTGCPAVRVQPLTPTTPETELLLSVPGVQRRIAFALFQALARDFGADPTAFGGVVGRVQDAAGQPVEGASVTVNGLWLAVTDREGRFAFDLLPPGETTLAITAATGGIPPQRIYVAAGALQPVVVHLGGAETAVD